MRPSAIAAVLFLLLAPSVAHAQGQSRTSLPIIGVVRDAETGEPLPGVNIFLDGTMRGTATDAEGRFRIPNVPSGDYKLVASMIGYGTQKQQVRVPGVSRRSFQFRLHRSTMELEGVTIRGDRSQWLKRLKRFKRLFIGETRNARKTTLENPEVLSFQVLEEPDPDLFRATSSEPLRVTNKALGYEVTFHFKSFEAQERARNQHTIYRGFTRFRELKPESGEQRRRWKENRRRTYEGSFLHFVDALLAGDFESEGFRVYRSPKMTLSRGRLPPPGIRRIKNIPNKTRVHDARALAQPGSRQHSLYIYVSTQENPYLRVEYEREPPSQTFTRRYRQGAGNPYNHQISWLRSPVQQTLVSTETGGFFPGYPLEKNGYWGWSQRAADQLPRQYSSGDSAVAEEAPAAVSSAGVPSTPSAEAPTPPPAEGTLDESASEKRAATARISATVGECTPHPDGFSCTLDVRRIYALGSRALPVSLTAFWSKALLNADAQSLPAMLSPGSEVEVALQPSSASVEVNISSPWTVTQVFSSSGAGQ